eukprot:1341467-Amorphochlora_amoeboformis.AAC.1
MQEESKKEANIEKATLPPFPLSSMVTGPPELHRKNRENSFRQGDTIGVRLDMIHGTIEFFKNYQPLGVAFFGLHQSVRAAVSAFGSQNVTLTSPAPWLLTKEALEEKIRKDEKEAAKKKVPGFGLGCPRADFV